MGELYVQYIRRWHAYSVKNVHVTDGRYDVPYAADCIHGMLEAAPNLQSLFLYARACVRSVPARVHDDAQSLSVCADEAAPCWQYTQRSLGGSLWDKPT